MPYIGNTVQTQGFAPAIDYFNGNGVTVTFTLSRPVASVAQVIVAVDNVIQNPSSAFGVVGNSITFTSAPLSGTNNIWVEYTSLITTYQGISQDPTVIGDIRATGGYLAEGDFGNSFIDGNLIDYVTGRGRFTVGELDDITFYHGGTSGRSEMMDLYYAGGAKIYGTTALTIPVGTTAQRPSSPAVGMHRMNTTTGFAEYWTGSQWATYGSVATTSVSYLIVAGGGGGGGPSGNGGVGGGGAGGFLTGSISVTPGVSYTVTVGAGGATQVNGSNSSFTPVGTTAVGGGRGGTAAGVAGASGGSGGGGGESNGAAGSGTSGQGNAGGNGNSSGASGAGGGGASAVGGNSVGNVAGNGGNGTASSITGVSVTYAGGGGGSVFFGNSGSGGDGGSGGGGNGATSARSQTATSGATNTGGGGGGFGTGQSGGGAGGSGVVIVAYPSTFKDASTTGTVARTTSGGNTIYTFTGSGTITF